MGRAPCCDKDNVKRGPWSPDEDRVLKTYIEKYGTGGNWIALPRKAGLRRCGKSCRLRWLNYLQPGIKHGGFTKEEDNIIATLYQTMGSRWSAIAAQLPGRTDNDVKNYWNTKLKKVYLTEDKPRNKAKTTLSNKPSERTPWIPATQAIPTLATEPHEPSTVNHNRSSSSSRSFLMESDLHLIVAQNFSEPSTGRVLSSTHDVSPASSSLTVDSVIGGGRGDHGGGGGGGFDGYDEQLFMDMDFWSTPDLPDWSGIHEHRVAGENDDQQEPCQDFTCMWESISI